jgi:hypothetical protein
MQVSNLVNAVTSAPAALVVGQVPAIYTPTSYLPPVALKAKVQGVVGTVAALNSPTSFVYVLQTV